jgi:DNA polymerase III epsilon subunit-like protein
MFSSLLDSNVEYAVLDVETTGLAARRYDRVIEVAVVRLSPTGSVTGRYVTLINPNRDVGPTDCHGITASDLTHAPRFECVPEPDTLVLLAAGLAGLAVMAWRKRRT